MTLTLSVRSFQMPETPGTWAWPPSLPSVPTSRATRVTSSANWSSWSAMPVEHARDLVDQRVAGGREAGAEVAAAHRHEPGEQLLKGRPVETWPLLVNVCHRLSRSWTEVEHPVAIDRYTIVAFRSVHVPQLRYNPLSVAAPGGNVKVNYPQCSRLSQRSGWPSARMLGFR